MKKSKTLKLNRKRVFVTGGAGFVGSHLVDALISEKPSLTVIVDKKAKSKLTNLDNAFKKTKDIKVLQADVSDFTAIKKITIKYKPEVVFHLATLSLFDSLKRPWRTVINNIQMTTNLSELQRLKLFKTLVLVSSSEAYGSAQTIPMNENHPLQPTTPYAASKAASDLIALSYQKTFGNDVVIVRPFNQYGPRQNPAIKGIITSTIKSLLAGKQPVVFGDGEQTRDYIFVRDTVKGIINAYKHLSTRGKVINLGSGKMIKMKKLVQDLINLGHKKIKIKYKKTRVADVRNHCADISYAKKLIKWSPKVSLEAGLKETYEWYKNLAKK